MKRAILKMSDSFLMQYLQTMNHSKEYTLKITNPLPEDVKIVRSGYDERGVLNLVLESEEFEDIKDHCRYPFIDSITFSKIYK